MSVEWENPRSSKDGGGRLRRVESFVGLRVVVFEGDGSVEDPGRLVTHHFDEYGKRIGEPVDPVLRQAAQRLIAIADDQPPEVIDDENAWRIGGAARRDWRDALADLRAALTTNEAA